MRKSSKSRVKGIAIFVVFLAVAMTAYETRGKKNSGPNMNFKPSANEFHELQFINKAQIGFSSSNIPKAREGISKIIDKYSKQRIRKQNEGDSGAYVFSIPQDKLDAVIAELKAYGTVGPQTEQIDIALVNLDFENESSKLASYESELNELNKIRQPSNVQNDRKEVLHSLLQESRSNLEKLRNSENVLLYLTLSPNQVSGGWVSLIKGMAKSFLIWLVTLSIGTVLVFYGTKLLMYFLAALGIRSPRMAGGGSYGGYSGYGGYSNYSRYSSRYGNSRRKIKRIYKDKGAPSTQQNEAEDTKNK
ncbi:MAG: hypothetical protein PHT37_05555 [Candidatus Cloacimonetes bacterium]|nr:hypothetical protein [Candidatus Cloacimonadota bacterium]MDD3563564.1 hypothetical protein [Candidatus Cloacimonadota bacterium]MDD4277333.1 hypothetical protein [Candidatus Cloacimonadota bacterium]MDY0326084.1 hypothetical protein [Candidatus Cloacimonadaceae bacterium]